MKVAIVANSSWNLYNFRSGIIKTLLSQNVEVIAIAPEDQYSKSLVEWGCKYIPIFMSAKGSNPFKDLLLLLKFYNVYRKNKPDAILHYTIKPNIYGTIAARLCGIPTINNVSGLGTVFLHQNITSVIAKKLYRFAFRFPYKVFFQNKDDLQLFIANKLLLPEKTHLVPGSGVDTKKFIPSVTLKQNSGFTFLMVSRLLFDKGIVEYLDAIRRIRKKGLSARFQIVGAIDNTANLGVTTDIVDQWVSEGLIEYHSFTDDLVRFYHQADCVVLPSYREGTPRSLLEAGACGIPMITTDVPGCREAVVDGQNGFLCKVKDAHDLADKMEKMLSLSIDEYNRFARFAREYVLENFDEKRVINTYLTTINSSLSGKNKLLKI